MLWHQKNMSLKNRNRNFHFRKTKIPYSGQHAFVMASRFTFLAPSTLRVDHVGMQEVEGSPKCHEEGNPKPSENQDEKCNFCAGMAKNVARKNFGGVVKLCGIDSFHQMESIGEILGQNDLFLRKL